MNQEKRIVVKRLMEFLEIKSVSLIREKKYSYWYEEDAFFYGDYDEEDVSSKPDDNEYDELIVKLTKDGIVVIQERERQEEIKRLTKKLYSEAFIHKSFGEKL